jgi:hypothetical protein
MEQLNARRERLSQRGSSRGSARGGARGGASRSVFTGGVLRLPSRHHQMCKQETDQRRLVVLRKGASLYDVENLEIGCADVRKVCISAPTSGWQLAACKLLVASNLRLQSCGENECSTVAKDVTK